MLVAARRTGLGQVRAYLAADLLRRVSERTGLAPTVIDLLPDGEPDLRAICADLNIHPPRHTLSPPVTTGQLAGQFVDGVREPVFDVGIRVTGEPGEPRAEALSRHWIEAAGADGTAAPAGSLVALGEEPLSVRYNLLRHGYGEPLPAGSCQQASGDGGDPRGEELRPADKELARWRELVARWALSPSGAMSPPYSDAITAAFADDLDAPAALRTLAALADDPAVPDGVKFETFAAADRLFGLDLARDVGR